MSEQPHAAGVIFALSDGRMLFLKRAPSSADHPGEWCFPGGTIDPGERPKHAALREAQEECGFDAPVRLGRPVAITNGFASFRVRLAVPFEPVLNHEHTEGVWAHPSVAPRPLHPTCAVIFDTLAGQPDRLPHATTAARILAMDGRPILSPVRAAAPIRIKYQQRLDALIEEMAQSLLYWLRAAYRADIPATAGLAQDASAADLLQAAFDKLQRRWLRRFDELAPKMADWFGAASRARVDGAMRLDLRKGGFTVKFQMSGAMRDAYDAVIGENMGLIRSIAEQHLTGVRTALMQSVQNGRDLAHIAAELEKRTGITKRRAAFIARDQNNKATAVMVKTRALELGITKARWVHSAGGKTPRPEHVKAGRDRLIFDLAKGHDFHNGEGVVWPGTAINCRCVAVPIVEGFE